MSMASSQHSKRDVHHAVHNLLYGESLTVVVKGKCMMPWLESNSKVQIAPARLYWPGDVVVHIAHDGRYLAHRLIGLFLRSGKVLWLTQADAADCPDAGVTSAAILGRIVGGECHVNVLNIPFAHRMIACQCFIRFVGISLTKKVLKLARGMSA